MTADAAVRDLWKDRSGQPTARHPDRRGNQGQALARHLAGPDGCEHTRAYARRPRPAYGAAMEADTLRGIRVSTPGGR